MQWLRWVQFLHSELWKTDFRKTDFCWKFITRMDYCRAFHYPCCISTQEQFSYHVALIFSFHRWSPAACDLPTTTRADWTKCEPATVVDVSAGQKPIIREVSVKTSRWLIRLVQVGNRWVGETSGRWQRNCVMRIRFMGISSLWTGCNNNWENC